MADRERDWRAEFPSAEKIIHMNHAGLSPTPRSVAQAVERFARSGLRFDSTTVTWRDTQIENARARVARLLDAVAEEIAFVRSTSEGLSLVAEGLEWRSGENVIAVDGDFPSNIYPWWGLRRHGVEMRLVEVRPDRCTVDEVAARIDRGTRLVAVSAVDWQSGARLDLASLGEICRARGAMLCVDAIQAVGALQIRPRQLGIDFMTAGGYKWLLAPEGSGFLWVAREHVEHLRPLALGWNSVVEDDSYLPYRYVLRSDARRFEPGTLCGLAVAGLGAATGLLLEVGMAEVERRIRDITDGLCDGLKSCGADIASPRDESAWSGIVTFHHGDPDPLFERLHGAGVVAKKRLGGIRLAPHFYNDASDVERVVSLIREM